MRVCNAMALKKIRALEERKRLLIDREDEASTFTYKEGETPAEKDYDYRATREEIAEIDRQVRAIRHALAKANCTEHLAGEFADLTIGEALVLLAQYSSEHDQLEDLVGNRQITRRVVSGGVTEYTECAYDVKEAKRDYLALREKMSALQVAIDSANLTVTVEI